MTRRHIHYEAAFEDFLRSRGIPYVPVDEQRKAIFAGARVKSFDFLVYLTEQTPWLVDVKGRKYPYEINDSKRYWENWITREDLDGLTSWQGVFGTDFEAVLVFAYWLVGDDDRLPTTHIHSYRDQHYAFFRVRLDDYRAHCRRRSPKWDTLSIPTARFRELARPVQELC